MLLNRFSLFHTSDPRELERQFEAIADARIRSAKMRDRGMAFRCNSIQSELVSLFSLSTDASLDVEYGPADCLRIVFQTHEASRVILGDVEVESGPQSAGYVMPEGMRARKIHPHGYTNLAIRVDVEGLRETLSSLCEQPIGDPVRFDQPDVSNQMFRRYVREAAFQYAHELNSLDQRFHDRLIEEFRALIQFRLLLYLPHNHSNLLEQPTPHPSRSQLHRAEEFIAENFSKPIDVVAIASATGASVRSVFRLFQQIHRESPRAYLKRIRLERARVMLADSHSSKSVIEVALACGFHSLGHFARAYLEQFGELPSDTVARR